MALPRLHALPAAGMLDHGGFPERCRPLLATGRPVALHLRDRSLSVALLFQLAQAASRLAPSGGRLFAHGRADLAAIAGSAGLHLRLTDLAPAELRDSYRPLWNGWIGVSVHSPAEAAHAVDEGTDYLLVGHVFETPTHPGRPPGGLDLVREVSRMGLPVIAIGGITPDNVIAVRDAGAYGVAVIRALWESRDPGAAAAALLAPFAEAA
jgi:thiamine-phosphate pyrophosphorylase